MTLMTTISLLSAVFAMVVLSEIFKLKKEVRKLNKITKYILEKNRVYQISRFSTSRKPRFSTFGEQIPSLEMPIFVQRQTAHSLRARCPARCFHQQVMYPTL
jgi:hypothetical protein